MNLDKDPYSEKCSKTNEEQKFGKKFKKAKDQKLLQALSEVLFKTNIWISFSSLKSANYKNFDLIVNLFFSDPL